MGIDPIHFNIVQTAAVGIGLFLPPMGVGLLMALKFANLTVGEHWRSYLPYIAALMVGLMLRSSCSRSLAVPAEERRPDQVAKINDQFFTFMTVSSWRRPVTAPSS